MVICEVIKIFWNNSDSTKIIILEFNVYESFDFFSGYIFLWYNKSQHFV